MNVFLTGATGYIGGSVAVRLVADGHRVYGLARSDDAAAKAEAFGMVPVRGSLDDVTVLKRAVAACDAVIHTADSDHELSAMTLLESVRGSSKPFLRASP